MHSKSFTGYYCTLTVFRMNGYRLAGDIIHLLAFIIIFAKVCCYKPSGVSGKMQILLCLVFTTRYLDLFTTFISFYNFDMKIVYLVFSYLTTLLIYSVFRKSYEKELDNFLIELLIVVCLILACLANYRMDYLEIAWTFSEYLEAVAAWPQFHMINKTKTVKLSVFFYLTALGCYRLLYIANWMYKLYFYNYCDAISTISGCVQVVPFIIFWILCLAKVVSITSEKTSWFAWNLTRSDNQNKIFIIEVSDDVCVKDKQDNLPLLNNLTEITYPNLTK